MRTPTVAIVKTGVANTASVRVGLQRSGCAAFVTSDPRQIDRADALVLPGVGSYSAGMRALRGAALVDVIRQWEREGRPLLAICLGLQLLCTRSDESPGVDGLGIVDATVEGLDDSATVPQMGWNTVDGASVQGWTTGDGYVAHSYCVRLEPPGWQCAWCTHGSMRFVAAMQRRATLACQFHPELSGAWGQGVIDAWCERLVVASC